LIAVIRRIDWYRTLSRDEMGHRTSLQGSSHNIRDSCSLQQV
jgi:hypothetical protein